MLKVIDSLSGAGTKGLRRLPSPAGFGWHLLKRKRKKNLQEKTKALQHMS